MNHLHSENKSFQMKKYETVLIKQAKYLFYLMKAGEIKPETFYLK